MIAFQIVVFITGAIIVIGTIMSAIRAFILPRGISDLLTRSVFNTTRLVLSFPLKLARSFEARDRLMMFYAPVSLLLLVSAWYLLISLGYACMYWALVKDHFTKPFD